MIRKKRTILGSPATHAFVRDALRLRAEAGQQLEARRYSLFDLLHGYVYARWIYLYIRIGTGEHPLVKKYAPVLRAVSRGWSGFKAWLGGSRGRPTRQKPVSSMADTYHGKVVSLPAARQLVLVNEPVNLPNLEHIIPYPRARDIILRNPEHIVALECPCRSAREHPCLPLDVCLVIGEPFASLVVAHNPQKARWITPQQAVDILQAEDDRGHVHHAFFKDAMLNRFYAICNCCSCCCAAIESQRRGSGMLASSGYVAQVAEAACLGCGACVSSCQFDALSLPAGVAQVDQAGCMGCGICVGACPNAALSLVRESSKGEPLEIVALMNSLMAKPGAQ